jgi:hypothetical protein
MNYLHSVADILIAQSVVRRWTAQRFVVTYRKNLHYAMALRIQMSFRCFSARTKMRKEKAARDIQKTWRGFWGYTDFVFTLADIIIVQKTVRGIQTRKRVAIMANTRNDQNAYNAAVMIQKKWRGFSAQMDMLFNLVHIIIVQVSYHDMHSSIQFTLYLLCKKFVILISANLKISVYRLPEHCSPSYCPYQIQASIIRVPCCN